MSDTFDACWLAMREPLDHAARRRAASVLAPLRSALRSACVSSEAEEATQRATHPGTQAETQTAARAMPRALVVLDLGAGTGSNLRFLAPRLGGLQRWHLTDHDVRLLSAAGRATARWARTRTGAPPVMTGAAPSSFATPGREADTTRRAHAFAVFGIDARDRWSADAIPLPEDLRALERLPFDRADLVTASALLDLVGEAWLRELVVRCAAAGAAVLWSLDVDGRARLAPADRADRLVRRDFARDTRRDKGLGPALSSQAGRRAAALLASAGYHVVRARSDWRIGVSRAAFADALLAGWATAATAARPSRARVHAEWLRRRRASLARRRLRILVGHTELAAWPRTAPSA